MFDLLSFLIGLAVGAAIVGNAYGSYALYKRQQRLDKGATHAEGD